MNERSPDTGFTLLEFVCALAITGMLAAILLPELPLSTSRAQLEAYALKSATLLRTDRIAAIRKQTQIDTNIDPSARTVRSGASDKVVKIPSDVQFEALLPQRCNERPAFSTISFLSTGISCGGVITLSTRGIGFEIRVNWLTGNVEVISRTPPKG